MRDSTSKLAQMPFLGLSPTVAVVAGARVAVLNEITGFSHAAATGAEDSYRVPLLPVSDSYQITVEDSGFKSAVRSQVALQVGQNLSAFAPDQIGKFGNSGRNNLYGPGPSETDIGLFKNFRVREPLQLQFRSELFNAFNRVMSSSD